MINDINKKSSKRLYLFILVALLATYGRSFLNAKDLIIYFDENICPSCRAEMLNSCIKAEKAKYKDISKTILIVQTDDIKRHKRAILKSVTSGDTIIFTDKDLLNRGNLKSIDLSVYSILADSLNGIISYNRISLEEKNDEAKINYCSNVDDNKIVILDTTIAYNLGSIVFPISDYQGKIYLSDIENNEVVWLSESSGKMIDKFAIPDTITNRFINSRNKADFLDYRNSFKTIFGSKASTSNETLNIYCSLLSDNIRYITYENKDTIINKEGIFTHCLLSIDSKTKQFSIDTSRSIFLKKLNAVFPISDRESGLVYGMNGHTDDSNYYFVSYLTPENKVDSLCPLNPVLKYLGIKNYRRNIINDVELFNKNSFIVTNPTNNIFLLTDFNNNVKYINIGLENNLLNSGILSEKGIEQNYQINSCKIITNKDKFLLVQSIKTDKGVNSLIITEHNANGDIIKQRKILYGLDNIERALPCEYGDKIVLLIKSKNKYWHLLTLND